jgi:hypothetical protein
VKTLLAPPQLAVIVTTVCTVTGLVWITTVPADLPAGTARLAGTEATAELELANATVAAMTGTPVSANIMSRVCPPVVLPE